MQWDGKEVNDYTPAEASEIATSSTASAFFEHILRGSDGKSNASQIAARIQAKPSWSGVRVVQLATQGGYRHKWFTLRELSETIALDNAAMVGAEWRMLSIGDTVRNY
jgi:hypothetical protein